MKISRRIVTAALTLAVIACALILTMRSVAEPPYDINLPSYQKLKAPYNDNWDSWETNILKKHSKKYCVTYLKKNGAPKLHCTGSQSDASQSEIIPVQNPLSPAPSLAVGPGGVNVTQNISCANQTDHDAIVATFDTSN